jgi:hypothetical protein
MIKMGTDRDEQFDAEMVREGKMIRLSRFSLPFFGICAIAMAFKVRFSIIYFKYFSLNSMLIPQAS